MDTLVIMDSQSTYPSECYCGYDLFGRIEEGRCPECGQSITQNVGNLENLSLAWRYSPSIWPKYAFVFSMFTCLLGLGNSILAIYFMNMLINFEGYRDPMTGIAMLYAPFIWVFVQLPVGILCLFFISRGRTTKSATVLRRYSSKIMGASIGGSFIILAAATIMTITNM